MRGYIFDIKHFTIHDGPGIRTTLFFKGCPLSCLWCHNPEGIKFGPENYTHTVDFCGKKIIENRSVARYYTVEEVMEIIVRDQIFYEESGGGVTFSGGEPLAQGDFLMELIEACRRQGIHTTLDTSAMAREDIFMAVASKVDCVLFDIKHTQQAEHRRLTGVGNELIMRNLEQMREISTPLIVRFPVIPGLNDGVHNIEAMKQLMIDMRSRVQEINLLPFHSTAHSKYDKFGYVNNLPELKSISAKDLEPLKAEFEAIGCKVKIGG